MGIFFKDDRVQAWEEFTLEHVVTSFVRIEIVSLYTADRNGFTEVEFYIGRSESTWHA